MQAAGLGRRDRQHLVDLGEPRRRPTIAAYAAAKAGPRLADRLAGDGVGAQGAGELDRGRPVPHRADRRPLRRRRSRSPRSSAPSRSAGWRRPRRSATSPRSWRATWRRTSPARPSRATAGERRPPSCWSRRDSLKVSKLLEGRVAIVTGAGSRHRPGARARARPARRGRGRQRLRRLAVRRGDGGVAGRGGGRGDRGGRRPGGRERRRRRRLRAGRPRWCEQAITTYGGLDILVNNAGFVRDRMLVNTSEEEWDAVIRVHLKGHFAPLRHAGAYWRAEAKEGRQRAARVINTSSGAGLQGSVGQTTYSAAKAGIAGMTLVAAQEMGRYGVTVNAIAPVARTRMTEGAFDTSAMARARGQLPDRRVAGVGGGRRRHRPRDRDRRRHRSPSSSAGATDPRSTSAAGGRRPRSGRPCASCSPPALLRSRCTARRGSPGVEVGASAACRVDEGVGQESAARLRRALRCGCSPRWTADAAPPHVSRGASRRGTR